jgi:hypothetical protein
MNSGVNHFDGRVSNGRDLCSFETALPLADGASLLLADGGVVDEVTNRVSSVSKEYSLRKKGIMPAIVKACRGAS